MGCVGYVNSQELLQRSPSGPSKSEAKVEHRKLMRNELIEGCCLFNKQEGEVSGNAWVKNHLLTRPLKMRDV